MKQGTTYSRIVEQLIFPAKNNLFFVTALNYTKKTKTFQVTKYESKTLKHLEAYTRDCGSQI